jgi:hypothetical protein
MSMSGEEKMYAVIWSTLFICVLLAIATLCTMSAVKKIYGKDPVPHHNVFDPDAECIKEFRAISWGTFEAKEKAFQELMKYLRERKAEPIVWERKEWGRDAGGFDEPAKEAGDEWRQ